MPEECAITVSGRQRSRNPSTDRLIANLAAAQAGRIGRWQLLAYGVTDAEIRSRIASGLLIVVRPGVYALTSPAQTLFDLGRSMSADRHAKTANQAFVETDLTLDDLC